MFLGELNYPVGNIEGIGPAAVRNLSALGVVSVAQLLRHYPVRYEDRKNPVPLVLSNPDNRQSLSPRLYAMKPFAGSAAGLSK